MGDQDLSPFERDILTKLLESYKYFRRIPIPTPEDKAQLPIIPTVCIQDSELKDYLTKFLNFVWMPALGNESHCLFLDLCIWDPFRNDSPDNWAMVSPGPYQKAQDKEKAQKNYEDMQEALSTYLQILNGEKVVAIDKRTGMQEILNAKSLGQDYVVADDNGKSVTLRREEILKGTKVIFDPLTADVNKKNAPKINTFYLLYKSFRKDFLVLEVLSKASATAYRLSNPLWSDAPAKRVRTTELTPRLRTSRANISRSPTDIERVIPGINVSLMHEGLVLEGVADPGSQMARVVDAHLAFAPKTSGEPDRYVYYVPSLFYPKDSGTGIGGLIFISTSSFSEEALSNFQAILDSILSKIGVYYLFDNFYDQSVRSAISSIMARNMSHNIGSHVIPRATVSAVRRRLLELGQWPEDDKELTLVSALKGALDEYTQRKSDFLAEITTEPLMTTRPAFLYREIILPLVKNTLLMDNIAANEGISYRGGGETNRLKLRVFVNDEQLRPQELMAVYKCRECERVSRRTVYTYPSSLPYSLTCGIHKTARLELKKVVNGDLDVEVELPGPLGEFALYSFLENYIRNVAKHNKACFRDGSDMEIFIKLMDLEEDFYYVQIWNNLIDPEQQVIAVDGKAISLHEALSLHINSKIIQPDGSLKRQAWGIGEMKICAALLGGPKDFVSAVQGEKSVLVTALSKKSLRPTRDARSLTVSSTKIDGEQQRLVYGFHLMKSKKMCAVLPDWPNDEAGEARITQLRKEGIWIYRSLQGLKDGLSGGESIASFRFALFDCSDSSSDEGKLLVNELSLDGMSDKSRLLPKFPFRILALTGKPPAGKLRFPKSIQRVEQDFATAGLAGMSGGEMLQWAWREWMRRWLGSGANSKTAIVNIFLEQRADEEPTKHWVERARLFNQRSSEIKLRVYEKGAANSTLPRDLCDVSDGERAIHLIYDRHRGLRNIFEHYMEHHKDWSYTILEKHSPDFTMLFSPKFPTEPDAHWTLPCEMAEAGLLKVLVIDERAAEFSLEQLGGETEEILHVLLRKLNTGPADVKEVLKWHLAWAAKIYICTHFGVEQEPQELHESIKKRGNSAPFLKVRVDRRVDFRLSVAGGVERSLDIDAVLIHQGILDEFSDDKKKGPTQNELMERLKAQFPFVVVESGRGIPPNLSDNEKFLPFSLLQHSVLGESVGKFGLTRILMSLARRRERSR